MRVSLAVGPLAAALLAATPALAQRTAGTLVGTVRDDSGGVLPGVAVSLTGDKIVGAQTTHTNDTGFYRFIALPPGAYELRFEVSGFTILRNQGVRVGVGAIEEIDVKMQVSALAEELTVVGDSPVVDTQTNQVATNYDADWVRNAPITRFSFFDLVAAAPGVSQNQQGGVVSTVFGSGTDENSYQIDGANMTSAVGGGAIPYVNPDAVEAIEVLTLGAPAEYGNVSGGVFNVVTRQGGNDFHGDVSFYLQTDGLTSRNTSDKEDHGFPYHREKYHDGTAQLLGPILKDKLWFFGSFQYQRDAATEAGADPRFFGRYKADRVFAKLNWQMSPKHRLSFGYEDDYYLYHGGASANATASVSGQNYGRNPSPYFTYTGVLSEKSVLEARLSGVFLVGYNISSE